MARAIREGKMVTYLNLGDCIVVFLISTMLLVRSPSKQFTWR